MRSRLLVIAPLTACAHLGWLTGRWLLLPLVVVGLILGYAYSVAPLRLKSRGPWNFACVWAVASAVPSGALMSSTALSSTESISTVIVCPAAVCRR